MDSNDDFYGKELNLNCVYMHTNFGQKYPKTAVVSCTDSLFLKLETSNIGYLLISFLFPLCVQSLSKVGKH